VTYDYGKYSGISYPRPVEDIRDVLDAGKSSYTYMLVTPRSNFLDVVQVDDDLSYYGILDFPEQLRNVDTKIVAGGGTRAGEYYAYSKPSIAWMDSVRRNDFASIVEIPQADLVEKIAVSAALDGGAAPTATVTFWAMVGSVWTPTGDVVVLDPTNSNLFVIDTHGLRLAISVTETGGATTAGVTYGLITNVPRTVVYTSPVNTSVVGQTTLGGDVLTDATVFFNQADILREVLLTEGLVTHRCRIAEVVSETSVRLVNSYDNSTPSFAGGTGLSWYIGVPTRTATGTVVGGTPAATEKTAEGNYIVPWPLRVTLFD
jgi:hypothetical protein